ncbi:MAG TPA: hypothetical protein VF608_11870, partial [Thermoanaerobaculia bacterium]
RGLRSVDDPTDTTPAEWVHWRNEAWETIGLSRVRGTVFLQLPATPLAASAALGVEGIEIVDSAETAEYVLTGRLQASGVEYAWVRPDVTVDDAERAPMPVRSAWRRVANEEDMLVLRGALTRLVRVHGWQQLESPAGNGSHYRIALRDMRNGKVVERGPLVGKQQYGLVLRRRETLPASSLRSRYMYVFTIDSFGKSVLLFPRPERGSVENRLPLTEVPAEPIAHPPNEIPLGEGPSFVVAPPYGADSYFLLTTDSPLSCTSCLEWDGVRAGSMSKKTPLDVVLSNASGRRDDESPRTSPYWSIDKVVFMSVPPPTKSSP